MEKRYQVFVSSTFTDLEIERQRVMQILMKLDCIPAGMELFPAADEEQWAFIQKIIDDCDYYLLIVGGRYGSMTAEGVSFTEKEYDYAVSKGIYVVALLHGDPEQLTVAKSEKDQAAREKLAAFREKARGGRLVKTWTSAAELLQEVTLSLVHAIKVHPRHGWVRGGSTANPELLAQINDLRQTNDQLRLQLAEASSAQVANLNLAPAESLFEVSGDFTRSGRDHHTWKSKLSWNQIIGIIAPNLLQPTNESHVRRNFVHAVRAFIHQDAGYNATINQTVFDTMKVQLIALGYIEVKSLATTDQTMALFWILTPTGRQVMLQMRTIQASPAIQASPPDKT